MPPTSPLLGNPDFPVSGPRLPLSTSGFSRTSTSGSSRRHPPSGAATSCVTSCIAPASAARTSWQSWTFEAPTQHGVSREVLEKHMIIIRSPSLELPCFCTIPGERIYRPGHARPSASYGDPPAPWAPSRSPERGSLGISCRRPRSPRGGCALRSAARSVRESISRVPRRSRRPVRDPPNLYSRYVRLRSPSPPRRASCVGRRLHRCRRGPPPQCGQALSWRASRAIPALAPIPSARARGRESRCAL